MKDRDTIVRDSLYSILRLLVFEDRRKLSAFISRTVNTRGTIKEKIFSASDEEVKLFADHAMNMRFFDNPREHFDRIKALLVPDVYTPKASPKEITNAVPENPVCGNCIHCPLKGKTFCKTAGHSTTRNTNAVNCKLYEYKSEL